MYAINTTLAGLRAITSPDAATVYQITDYGGGQWFYDPTDSASADNTGTIVVSTSGARFKRVHQPHQVSVLWFGAEADYSTSSYTGTDNTSKFQAAVDYIFSTGGGTLIIPVGNYLVDGTVYILSPNHYTPLTIEGQVKNVKVEDPNDGGSCLFRNVNGDFFRVNMNAAGEGLITDSGFLSFAITGLSFSARWPSSQVNCIVTFRTRGIYQNLSATKCQYLIYQPLEDSLGHPSYNDNSVYSNLKITQSRLGGLYLCYCDTARIETVLYENPHANAKGVIYLAKSSATFIGNVIAAVYVHSSTLPDSSVITLYDCRTTTIDGLHVEKSTFESIIDIQGGGNLQVNNIHERFSANNTFKLKGVTGLRISSWFAWDNKNAGYYDILFSGASSMDIKYDNIQFLRYDTNIPHEDPKVARAVLVGGDASSIAALNTLTDTLNGYTVGPNAPLAATDTELTAFRKIQGQLNDKVSIAGSYNNPSWLSSLAFSRVFSAIAYTTDADYVVPYLGSTTILTSFITANRTVTLPDPTLAGNGGRFLILVNRSIGSFTWSTNYILVDTAGGVATSTLNSGTYFLVCDGDNWRIVSLYKSELAQTYIASGNGVSTQIQFAHGLPGITSNSFISVGSRNQASAGIVYFDVDSTNVYINYNTAPAAGTGNLKYSVEIKR